MKVFPSLALALAPLTACQTVETRRPHVGEAHALHGLPREQYVVLADAAEVGFVVQFEHSARAGEALFVVRNAWEQDLGLVDHLGRAYRFRPHADEPECLGTGTVAAGVARILGRASCELTPRKVHGPNKHLAHGAEGNEKE